LLLQHKQYINKIDKAWIWKVAGLSVIIGVGLYAFVLQIVDGHIITGMRDNVVWGVYIVNFVFILGLSYAGALIGGIFHLARTEWSKPLQRILKLITVFSLIIAPIYILLCIGRPDRLLNLFTHARIQSPITWDVIAIMTDMIFAIFYLYLTYIKDFALIRDNARDLGVPEWRIKYYKFFALGYKNTPGQAKLLNQALDILAAIIIPTSIIAYSLLAWLFGMNLHVGWNSSIYAPFFVLTAIYSGIAFLIVILWVYRKTQNLQATFNDEHFTYLGFALVILSLFYGYFYFSEYITDWYNMSGAYKMLWSKMFDPSEYGIMLWTCLILVSGIPILFVGLPFFRSVNTIALTSVLVLVGLWGMRYLMIVPVLETPNVPIQDIRPD